MAKRYKKEIAVPHATVLLEVAIGDATIYQAAQVVGADFPDIQESAIRQKLSRWRRGGLTQVADYAAYLNALGYDVVVQKRG